MGQNHCKVVSYPPRSILGRETHLDGKGDTPAPFIGPVQESPKKTRRDELPDTPAGINLVLSAISLIAEAAHLPRW